MCEIKINVTLEEENIHIEESGSPDSLLYASEGEDPGPVTRLAWRDYLRHHPDVNSLEVYLTPELPPERRREVEENVNWLMRQIIFGRAGGKAG